MRSLTFNTGILADSGLAMLMRWRFRRAGGQHVGAWIRDPVAGSHTQHKAWPLFSPHTHCYHPAHSLSDRPLVASIPTVLNRSVLGCYRIILGANSPTQITTQYMQTHPTYHAGPHSPRVRHILFSPFSNAPLEIHMYSNQFILVAT